MRIEIVDVGPRDGLQNEDRTLSPEVRAELCEKLAAAGVPRVEAASFVNPKRVPQMAGAEEVMAAIERSPGTTYAGLVLNEKGYERAIEAGVDEVRYAFPVTETFARRNQNTTVADATQLAARLVERARLDGVRVSITLSAAFGDPFEGRVEPEHVLEIMKEAGVPAGKLFTAEDMLSDEQYAARQNIVTVEDPEIGPFPMQNVVPRLSETPGEVRWTGPKLGQHNNEVFKEMLGMTEEDLDSLRERGIV